MGLSAIQVALKCDGAKQHGKGFQARCPAHDDNKPSLSISHGENGGVVLHCHAGCKPEDIVKAIGLKISDLMPPRHHSNGAGSEIEARYDYRDASGKLVYQVLRKRPKGFYQRRPEGNGWINNLDGVERVLYRLPELLAADPKLPVFIVEGEKDADRLAAMGFIATTNAGGAGKWRAEYCNHLTGRDVVILPDNDDPGRKHALDIARQLTGKAAGIKLVELPNLPPGGDVSDWLNSGGTADALKQLAEETSISGPETLQKATRIELIPSRVFATTEYQQRYLVKKMLVANQPAIVGGRSKTMKTSLIVDLALSLGSGAPFLGEFPCVNTSVAVLSGESGQFTIQETARRISEAKGIDFTAATVHWGFTLPQLARDDDLIALQQVVQENEIRVLVIDPAYLCLLAGTVVGLRSSDVFTMGPLLLRLSELGQQSQCTVILCHHCRKNSPVEQYSPPELEELSMAGFAEWARQWLLLGRREAYDQGSGIHRLWLNVGGSAGHSGCYAVDIDEGHLQDDFSGRRWAVAVSTAHDARKDAARERELKRIRQQEDREESFRLRLLDGLKQFPEGETANVLKQTCGLNNDNFGIAVRFLIKEGRAVACQVRKGKKVHDGYRPTGK